ncbi:hypothetical protein A8990_1537 [Paenibacillus taihuensis]|uniref:Uncharacterized protein n=1 Tax=Paenibacillus taihuensis TaxID=1156355 RepID=A0A3D9Q7D0_9BACL|nr:hypothetical protein [Paenibacillus taihuensis]REE57498.1 hypothetical protein A8990_1537 [Paenibacillus taihuensis]
MEELRRAVEELMKEIPELRDVSSEELIQLIQALLTASRQKQAE